MEANRTPEPVLHGFQANTHEALGGFELGLTPVVAPASLVQEALGQEGLVAGEVGVEDIVEFAVAFAALGQPFAARLVGSVVEFDIVGETSGNFAGGYRVLLLLLIELRSHLRFQHLRLCNLLLRTLLWLKLMGPWL